MRRQTSSSSDGLKITVIGLIAVIALMAIVLLIMLNGFIKQGAALDHLLVRDACVQKIAREPYSIAGFNVPLQRSLQECYLPTPPAKQ